MGNKLTLIWLFFAENDLRKLDRQVILLVIHKRPQLNLWAPLLSNDSCNIHFLVKLLLSTLLEPELLTILTAFAYLAKNVCKWIWRRNLLSLIELTDHLLFDLVSVFGFADIVGNLGRWWTAPIKQSDNLCSRVESHEEADYLTA